MIYVVSKKVCYSIGTFSYHNIKSIVRYIYSDVCMKLNMYISIYKYILYIIIGGFEYSRYIAYTNKLCGIYGFSKYNINMSIEV